jgi:hypothetical protein
MSEIQVFDSESQEIFTINTDTTGALRYNQPIRPKVIIKDKYNEETLHVFDAFEADDYFQINRTGGRNDIIATDIGVNLSMGETGSFSVVLDDTLERNIDRNILDNGCFIIIQDGRDQTEFKNTFYGLIDRIETNKGKGFPKTSYEDTGTQLIENRGREPLRYTLSGLGTARLFSHRFITMKKIASKDPITNEFIRDPLFNINRLFEDIIVNKEFLPLQAPILKDGANFSLEGISDEVNDFYPGVDFTMMFASQALSTLATAAGAYWMVDEHNRVTLRYPTSGLVGHSGINIKTYRESDDLAQNTSYLLDDNLVFTDSISPTDGFINRIFGNGASESTTAQLSQDSFTDLTFKDISQEIPGKNRLTDIGAILKRTGGGTEEPNPQTSLLTGRITRDKSGTPAGSLVATFSIPVLDIPESPTLMSIIPIFVVRERSIDPETNYWLTFNTRGIAINNCSNWYHNNQFATLQAFRSAIRRLPRGRTKLGGPAYESNNTDWAVTVNGPTYSYSLTEKLSQLAEASDPLSILRWSPTSPVETSVSLPYIHDAYTMYATLNSILTYSAQMQRIYQEMRATLPYNTFRVGFNCSVFDYLIESHKVYRNAQAEIQRISYNWSGTEQGYGVGMKEGNILLKGYVNADEFPLQDDDESDEEE